MSMYIFFIDAQNFQVLIFFSLKVTYKLHTDAAHTAKYCAHTHIPEQTGQLLFNFLQSSFFKATTSTHSLIHSAIAETISQKVLYLTSKTFLNQAQEHNDHSLRLMSTEDQTLRSSQAQQIYLHFPSRHPGVHVASLTTRINPRPQVSGRHAQALSLRPPTPPKRMELLVSRSRPCPSLPSTVPSVVHVMIL